jgi:hypothetical protein
MRSEALAAQRSIRAVPIRDAAGLYFGSTLTSTQEADHDAAWAIVALGAGAVIGGFAMIIDSNRTTLDFHASSKASRAPRLNLGRGLAFTPRGFEF